MAEFSVEREFEREASQLLPIGVSGTPKSDLNREGGGRESMEAENPSFCSTSFTHAAELIRQAIPAPQEIHSRGEVR